MTDKADVKFMTGKLRERVSEKYGSLENFARSMGISVNSMEKKLSGGSCFTLREIVKAAELLDIEPENIGGYFFALDVQKC